MNAEQLNRVCERIEERFPESTPMCSQTGTGSVTVYIPKPGDEARVEVGVYKAQVERISQEVLSDKKLTFNSEKSEPDSYLHFTL